MSKLFRGSLSAKEPSPSAADEREHAFAPGAEISESAAGSDEELLALLSDGHRHRLPPRWILIALTAVIIAAAGGLLWWSRHQARTADNEVTYRQYTVQRGDITVGTSESSSISLDRETITFPVSTTVEKVFVKAGSSVQEGDPLMQLNLSEIQAGLVSYQLQLELASLELEQARLDQQSRLLAAEQTYQSALLEGSLAETAESVTVTQLERELSDAQDKLTDALEDLDTYRHYEDDYDDDYSRLTTLSNRAESYKSLYQDYKTRYDKVAALEIDLEVQQELLANTVDEDEQETISERIEEILGEIAIYGNGDDSDTLYKLYQQTYDKYIDAQSRYQDYLADFNGTYDIEYGDSDALEDRIESLRDQVESYAIVLDQAELSQQTGALDAEQQRAMTQALAASAEAQYNLTVLQLSQSVDAAQETYDQTLRQINEIQESISDDGIVYAPCTGMIVSINVEEGDSFDVTYDEDTDTLHEQTLLMLTDISSVYVPITVSEEDILNVSIGQEASVTMNAFADRTFDAEVDTISVEASRSGAATVSYTVNVRYKGTNTLDMYDGMSAEITLIQRQVRDVLYVNNQAITNTDGVATVQRLAQDGSQETVEVETGFSDGQYVEIVSGLREGDILLAQSGVSRA